MIGTLNRSPKREGFAGDVAVAGFRGRRHDAEGHQAPFGRLSAGDDGLAELGGIADQVIRCFEPAAGRRGCAVRAVAWVVLRSFRRIVLARSTSWCGGRWSSLQINRGAANPSRLRPVGSAAATWPLRLRLASTAWGNWPAIAARAVCRCLRKGSQESALWRPSRPESGAPESLAPGGSVDAPREICQSSSRPGGGEQQPASPSAPLARSPPRISSLRPSDVVISSRSLPPLIRSLTVPTAGPSAASHAQPQQIEQVKFPLVQFGPVIRGHQQFMAHKGFGGAAAVDSLKPHHKKRLAGHTAELVPLAHPPCDCAAGPAP